MIHVRIITVPKNTEIIQVIAKLEELLNGGFTIAFVTAVENTLVYTLMRTQHVRTWP